MHLEVSCCVGIDPVPRCCCATRSASGLACSEPACSVHERSVCAWEGVEGRCDGTAHADENLCTVRARRLLHACRVSACCREALDELRMLSCSAVLCDVM